MKSILNGINKKDAEILLRALRQYAQAYYEYKNGDTWMDNIREFEYEDISELTRKLADKIGLDENAGF